MSGKRPSRRVSTVPIRKPKEEGFVAADAFDFDKEFRSPKGVMTRARRSSVVLTKPPLQLKTNRRKSMMPTLAEKPMKVTNKRKSVAPEPKIKPIAKSAYKGIELKNFYESPVNSPRTSTGKKVSRVNKIDTANKQTVRKSLQLAESPKKKVAPHEKNILSDIDILKSLDSLIESPERNQEQKPAKTPVNNKKKATAKTPATNKKKATAKTWTPEVVAIKTPVKTPKSAKTPPASIRRATRMTPAVVRKTPVVKKTPVAKMAPVVAKSTKKAAPKSTKKVVSVKCENLANEVKQVTIRLRALDSGIHADPQVLLSQLESLPATPERVDQVVENILTARVSRKRKSDDSESVDEVTANKKPRMQDKTPAKSVKKTPAAKADSAKKAPGTQKRPVLIAKKTLMSAKKTPGLRRAMARTAGPLVSTPVQVNPAGLLKRNLRTKVESAIETKMAQKPNSSPYILNQQDGENSPKFEKITKSPEAKNVVMKAHITGTPAVARRGRKFGTTIQPSMLAADSPVPMTTRRMSSTPMRGKRALQVPTADIVNSTPIRAPTTIYTEEEMSVSLVVPMSPQAELVTGKLGKLCAIM